MDSCEIVVNKMNRAREPVAINGLTESIGEPRKSAAFHSNSKVLAFDMAGGNHLRERTSRNALLPKNEKCSK